MEKRNTAEESVEETKRKELKLLFKKCFKYTEEETKTILPENMSEEALSEVFKKEGRSFGGTFCNNFYGRFFTVENFELQFKSYWKEIAENSQECLEGENGRIIFQILNFLLENGGKADYADIKGIFGKVRGPLDTMQGYKMIVKRSKPSDWLYPPIQYEIPGERRPLVEEILSRCVKDGWLETFTTEIARKEHRTVIKLKKDFDDYLKDLLENRFQKTIEFSKQTSTLEIARYLKGMFGEMLYFDSLLSIVQQYSLADVPIINSEGEIVMSTGFNLALFGAPGTGKTFAIDDMIRGNKERNVKPHGLPGKNRYCGGMTAARFIRMGETYQDEKFNFIIPEFNDWFKYKGMVEPLKLALDRKEVIGELKNETVGPYKFNSFFSVNYNTKVLERGYKVTIGDPNFNAIEDRMLCRLHKQTEERYKAISQSQEALALGKIKMEKAQAVRDHLTLIYAIETEHPFIKDKFPSKKIVLDPQVSQRVKETGEEIIRILKNMGCKIIPFSPRLEQRTIQLACSMSLPSYFNQSGDFIKVDYTCLDFAVQFFIEEAFTRSQKGIDIAKISAQLLKL